jgi:hypothetical protein
VKTKKDDKEQEEITKEDEEVIKKDEECSIQVSTPPPPPAMPPPWCRCPRLTIPCDCEDPELCGSFF